ncbi:MAG TPA: hypothetical protein VFA21_01650 [Pyrinomonadaceae bacterium]|nr:hypothetical protein [Pyrinomonadaceae bacterium]
MRKEYDFSEGVRGKHAGLSFRVVGDTRRNGKAGVAVANKIQKAIERDLKSRDGFKVFWNSLDKSEKEDIRAAWVEKINDLLEKTNP